MKHTSIRNFITLLNTGKIDYRVFRRTLKDNVEYAKVWPNDPLRNYDFALPYHFFLIKSSDGKYIGAVLDMGKENLHAYIFNQHRKKGYLTNAMNNVILPFLYQTGRQKQTFEFENPNLGEHFVKKYGFKKIDRNHAEIDLTEYQNALPIKSKGKDLTVEEINNIIGRFESVRSCLRMIKDQLDTAYGECKEICLDHLVDQSHIAYDDIRDFFNTIQTVKS